MSPGDDGTPQAPGGTQAIRRALGVLKLLAGEDGALPISRIAARTGLSSGTANRVVRALLAEGLVAHDPRTDSYYLGAGTVLLGQAAQQGFGLDKSMPVLEALSTETEESINLSIREHTESVVMLRVQSTLALRFEQHVGARFPLYSTASGKAILAYSTDADDYLAGLPEQLEPLTPGTVRSRARLTKQLAETRRRGYSTDEEENVAGVRCVGAPVLDADGGAQAALVVQVPTVRMPSARMRELGHRAVTAAKEIARFVPIDRVISR